MSKYNDLPSLFQGICDAIRAKDGTTDLINHQDIPERITALSGGAKFSGGQFLFSNLDRYNNMDYWLSQLTSIESTDYMFAYGQNADLPILDANELGNKIYNLIPVEKRNNISARRMFYDSYVEVKLNNDMTYSFYEMFRNAGIANSNVTIRKILTQDFDYAFCDAWDSEFELIVVSKSEIFRNANYAFYNSTAHILKLQAVEFHGSMEYFCANCDCLESVIFSRDWQPQNINYAFAGCDNLTTISNFNLSYITQCENTFDNCTSISEISVPNGTTLGEKRSDKSISLTLPPNMSATALESFWDNFASIQSTNAQGRRIFVVTPKQYSSATDAIKQIEAKGYYVRKTTDTIPFSG